MLLCPYMHAGFERRGREQPRGMQLQSVRKQNTKFGEVLVAETHAQPQRFLLGFQISPAKRLASAVKQAQAMVQLSTSKPQFGLAAADILDPQQLPTVEAPAFEEMRCGHLCLPRNAVCRAAMLLPCQQLSVCRAMCLLAAVTCRARCGHPSRTSAFALAVTLCIAP